MNQDRGQLRVYLGVAPGVGKTHAMLDEGVRRKNRGTDVVVALAQPRGRSALLGTLAQLETVPALVEPTTGVRELDVAGVLARRPQVALIDDLAHHDPTGSHPERWRAVEQVLAAGIDVVTCVDIHHLESLADVVESITGVRGPDAVPDAVVRAAEQVELVDMTSEALRRRLAHGNLYPPEQVDAAIEHFYRPGNLATLRELALLWMADRVDVELERYRHKHAISEVWTVRQRVLVAVSGAPGSDALVRSGARLASRGASELHVVHVLGRRPRATAADLAPLRALTDDLGGRWHESIADDPADAVLESARDLEATHVVIGYRGRRKGLARWRTGLGERLLTGGGPVDVVVVATPPLSRTHPARQVGHLARRRVWPGFVLALVVPPLAGWALSGAPGMAELAMGSMLMLANAVCCALVGGRGPAVAGALIGSLSLNWFLTPPHHSLSIADPVGVVSLLIFLVVALAVASVVDTAVRRRAMADRAQQEADDLTVLNRALMTGDDDPRHLLELLRERFGLHSVSLLQRDDGWQLMTSVGDDPPTTPDEATDSVPLSPTLILAARGAEPLPGHHATVLSAFATHLAAALERQQLRAQSADVERLRDGNRVRTALLAALSHDLRTPLASIKTAVSGLRDADVQWSEDDVRELLATIEGSTDRLHRILANLLDLSRLQTGVVQPASHEIELDDVVASTLAHLPHGDAVAVELNDDTPPVDADGGLLERVVANLVENALRYTPPGDRVTVRTGHASGRVQLEVIDHGPGVPAEEREQIFLPFRRLDDVRGSDGVGLGLAVARGLTEAMGGQLVARDTPGGGLTMVIQLPARSSYGSPAPDSVLTR